MAVVISAASISLTGCSITDIRRLRGKNNNSYDTQYSYNTTDNEAFEEFTDGLSKNLSLMIHCHYIPFLNILTNMALQIMMLPLDV